MKKISLDIETFSSVDLSKAGVYKYADSEDFEILLFAYSIDDGEVDVIDIKQGEKIPKEIIEAIFDESISKWAFNANFERVCLSKFLNKYLDPKSWYCSMVWAAYIALPLSLENVASVLNLKKQKMLEGKSLIRYFSMPCKATKSNNFRTRNLPIHDKHRWDKFKEYNKKDVEVEILIKEKLSPFPMPNFEWDNYHLDQKINDRGILIDSSVVQNAISISNLERNELLEESKKLTGLENPNSVSQMKDYLNSKGIYPDSLDKKSVKELLKEISDIDVKKVLELRQELSKSSIKKYDAMKNVYGSDFRARGLIQFYGANRTGRYSGRLIQVQNLRRNSLNDLDLARELVKENNYKTIELLFDSTSDVLSQLIRTAFIPKKDNVFVVSDFSAIEARVLAWLSDEKWRMDAFSKGEDIYCASASQMFGVKVKKHGENSHLRQKGKIAELALGYNGSVGALKAMGAIEMGLNEDELNNLVESWRESNPNIVKLWWDLDKTIKDVIKSKSKAKYKNLFISYERGILFIKLPSGRRLSYVKASIGVNRFGGESVTYYGIGVNRKWDKLESYGGKFVENIVQAIARDILAEAMIRLDNENFSIVMHVHDEVVIEDKKGNLEKIKGIMSITPKWADGLILDCDAYECDFYRKD